MGTGRKQLKEERDKEEERGEEGVVCNYGGDQGVNGASEGRRRG